MTYGHLFLIVIGLAVLAGLWRLAHPPSEFRREYPMPGLDTPQSARLLAIVVSIRRKARGYSTNVVSIRRWRTRLLDHRATIRATTGW